MTELEELDEEGELEDPTEASLVAALRAWWSENPAWWCVIASAMAWAPLVMHGLGHSSRRATIAGEMTSWTTMVIAMMLPLTLQPVRDVAARSLWSRRRRAMVVFVVAYLAPWLAAGVPIALLRTAAIARSPTAPLVAFALAAAWLLVPLRATAFSVCHRTAPLAPSGWRADRDCMTHGAIVGGACVVTCLPLMAACALAGHTLVTMVAAAAIGAVERFSFRPPERAVFGATLAVAIVYGVLAITTA